MNSLVAFSTFPALCRQMACLCRRRALTCAPRAPSLSPGRTVRWGWQQELPGCQLQTGFTNATRGGLARTQRSGGTGAPHREHQERPGRGRGEKGCCRLSLREAGSPWRAQDRPAAGRGDPSFGGCRGVPADVQAVCLLRNGAIHFLERSGALGGIEMRIWCCGGRERVQPSRFFTVSAEWSHGDPPNPTSQIPVLSPHLASSPESGW